MRILVLHSDPIPNPPPEELDTLIAAEAVAAALARKGHHTQLAAFRQDTLAQVLTAARAETVFNLVESVGGLGKYAPQAPALLAHLGVRFTGVTAQAMDITNDKRRTKQMLRDAGLATPDWSTPPDWTGLDDRCWIVKSALEDASLGLDDGCVVRGSAPTIARAEASAARWGGDWFAEEFVEGREFNIALLQDGVGVRIFPMAEMCFVDWPTAKPRIVGYEAKWDEGSAGWSHTVRRFGVERDEPALAAALHDAGKRVWRLFDLCGFVRVDFRVTDTGKPLILEINTNPCISPDAGFAAAAEEGGMDYDSVIEAIVQAAS